MKEFIKAIFVLLMLVGSVNASDNCSSDSMVMIEPCEPIDLCLEACDPLAD